MLLRTLVMFALGGYLATAPHCGDKPGRITKGNLNVVTFPSLWIKKDNIVIASFGRYEIRRSKTQPQELIFAYQERMPFDESRQEWMETAWQGSREIFSENYYGVDRQSSIRALQRQDWEQAERVLQSRYQIRPKDDRRDSNAEGLSGELSFVGKTYAKSGQYWSQTMLALHSPSKRWLVVFSYSSQTAPQPNYPNGGLAGALGVGGGGEPTKGEMFIDIYDTISGEKVIAGNASYSHAPPSSFFDDALWIENRYFILPLEGDGKSCFLATMPE